MYYPSSENKGADQLRFTAKLICVFVFAYADCWFSHGVAHLLQKILVGNFTIFFCLFFLVLNHKWIDILNSTLTFFGSHLSLFEVPFFCVFPLYVNIGQENHNNYLRQD